MHDQARDMPRRSRLLAWSVLVIVGCLPLSSPTEREGAEPLTLVFEREGAESLTVDIRLEAHVDPLLQAEHVCALTGEGDGDGSMASRSTAMPCSAAADMA